MGPLISVGYQAFVSSESWWACALIPAVPQDPPKWLPAFAALLVVSAASLFPDEIPPFTSPPLAIFLWNVQMC